MLYISPISPGRPPAPPQSLPSWTLTAGSSLASPPPSLHPQSAPHTCPVTARVPSVPARLRALCLAHSPQKENAGGGGAPALRGGWWAWSSGSVRVLRRYRARVWGSNQNRGASVSVGGQEVVYAQPEESLSWSQCLGGQSSKMRTLGRVGVRRSAGRSGQSLEAGVQGVESAPQGQP